jgi:nitronate monooxygenase
MTALRAMLGIELPIIQAPMAGSQDSALAVAVSNAGGLGSLAGAMLSAEALRTELRAIRAQTSKPFNVNFF